MDVREVAEVLWPYGLQSPDLEMLRADEKRYKCLLLQPSGPVYAGAQRIGCFDTVESDKKASSFIKMASTSGAHLVVTPEYFFPWATLQAALLAGTQPALDALWVLGCESIQQDQLEAFKKAVSQVCEVIYEPCENLAQDRTLLDPAALVFLARRPDGTNRLVVLVQFKTFPSRDDIFLEEGLLRRGTLIYRFRGHDGKLSAATFICSDAFDMKDAKVAELMDRSTLIHIQLNPDPRNSTYRQYRKTIFETDARTSDCHIVCLNWARSVVQIGEDGASEEWKNIAGSAWYCPESGCKYDDAVVLPNHQHGLYYTYMRERRHALFFHYDEAVFELQVPKVVTVGKAIMANRNGPSATQRYVWSVQMGHWNPADQAANSGFEALLAANADANSALAHIGEGASVLDIERILALSAGAITGTESWFTAKEIDSCQIGPDEVIHRITVAQDNDASAANFRYRRIDAVAHVRNALDTFTEWPPQVRGITKDAQIEWNPDPANRSFNVRSADGKQSLVAYVGESPPERVLENCADKLINVLRRAGGPHQTRLCIIYRRFGHPKFASLPGLTRFDSALEDATDILSVHSE